MKMCIMIPVSLGEFIEIYRFSALVVRDELIRL